MEYFIRLDLVYGTRDVSEVQVAFGIVVVAAQKIIFDAASEKIICPDSQSCLLQWTIIIAG